MSQNLMIAAVIVVVLWVLILGIYLAISRRQPGVQAQMQELEEQLQQLEREVEKQ
jgi:hypothetical protein